MGNSAQDVALVQSDLLSLRHPSRASLLKRIKASVSWSIVSSAVYQSGSFIGGVCVARILGKNLFGELAMVLSTVGTVGVFGGLALALTTTKHVAEFRTCDPQRAGRFIALCTAITVLSAAIFSLLLFVFSAEIAKLVKAPMLSSELRVGCAIMFFSSLTATQSGILAGFEAFHGVALANLVRGIASLTLVVGGAWAGGLHGAVWGTAGCALVTWAAGQLVLVHEMRKRGIRPQYEEMFQEYRSLWQFSLPAFLSGAIAGPVTWCLFAILASQPDGYAQLGMYNAADRWRLFILFVPTCVATAILPIISDMKGSADRRLRKVTRSHALLVLAITVPLVLGVTVLAPKLIALFGESYRPASTVLVLLALSSIPMALNTVFGQILLTANAAWIRFGFDAVLSAILLLATVVLVPAFHSAGLAAANLIGFTLVVLGLIFVCRRFAF